MLDDDHARRRGGGIATGRFDHQETPAVGRHVVRAARTRAGIVTTLEHLHRRAGVPARAARLDVHAHQRAVRTEVEQFLAAPRPQWLPAARRGNLPLAAADIWKWPDVDFARARTVGFVRQPPAIGRNDPVALVELRL